MLKKWKFKLRVVECVRKRDANSDRARDQWDHQDSTNERRSRRRWRATAAHVDWERSHHCYPRREAWGSRAWADWAVAGRSATIAARSWGSAPRTVYCPTPGSDSSLENSAVAVAVGNSLSSSSPPVVAVERNERGCHRGQQRGHQALRDLRDRRHRIDCSIGSLSKVLTDWQCWKVH